MRWGKKKGQLYLTAEFQPLKVEGMMEIGNHHLSNPSTIIVLGKHKQWMLKLIDELWLKKFMYFEYTHRVGVKVGLQFMWKMI